MLDGAGEAGTLMGPLPRTPAAKQLLLPEDVMFIWMWIKRRRAAQAAKAAAPRPATEDLKPVPPSATPQ